MKEEIFRVIRLILIMVTLYLGYRYMISCDVSHDTKLSNFIENHQKVQEVSILEKTYKDNLVGVLYTDGESEKLFILEQDSIFRSRYSYFGGGSASGDWGSYNYWDPQLGTLIILYGVNNVEADYYEFMINDEKYIRENLGEYIVDFYILKDSTDMMGKWNLYDKDKQLVWSF